MPENLPVRCPVCRCEHTYVTPSYTCSCGAPVPLPVLRGEPAVQVRHRTWAGSWVRVRCSACDTEDEWPQPEINCGCGTVLRLPVELMAPRPSGPLPERPQRTEDGGPLETGPAALLDTDAGSHDPPRAPSRRQPPDVDPPSGDGGHAPPPDGSDPTRPPFPPDRIHTEGDARRAAARYLYWLGFQEPRVTDRRVSSGVELRGPDVIAHVDADRSPTAPRQVETLWLNGLNESTTAVCFSLPGYDSEARARAEGLGVPLFRLSPTAAPAPVNDAAAQLVRGIP